MPPGQDWVERGVVGFVVCGFDKSITDLNKQPPKQGILLQITLEDAVIDLKCAEQHH